jgi:DNA-binding NarL/FixJ family response regulator
VAALSVDSAALEREVRVSSELWAEAAIDKLQAVVGEIEIAGVLARRVARNLHPHADLPGVRCCSDDERLSDREREVLAMLSRGSTVSQIARERALSVKTVSTYRSRMLRKLGFATTAELMRYGIKIRLDD